MQDRAIYNRFKEFIEEKWVVNIVEGFLKVYEGDIGVLVEGFSNATYIIERVDMVNAGAMGVDSILFVTDFIFFF